MNAAAPIVIEAVVADSERPALAIAGEQLDEALRAATGRAWPIDLRYASSVAAAASAGAPSALILSLLPELARAAEPIAEVEARWRAELAVAADKAPSVFLMTIFRHVARAMPTNGDADGAELLERIRRLDLLAPELSHDGGVAVLDIDRALAFIGARALETDYRLGGRIAAEVAAHTIVAALLAEALDATLPAEVLARVQQHQGNLLSIYAYVQRRMQRPSPAASRHGLR